MNGNGIGFLEKLPHVYGKTFYVDLRKIADGTGTLQDPGNLAQLISNLASAFDDIPATGALRSGRGDLIIVYDPTPELGPVAVNLNIMIKRLTIFLFCRLTFIEPIIPGDPPLPIISVQGDRTQIYGGVFEGPRGPGDPILGSEGIRLKLVDACQIFNARFIKLDIGVNFKFDDRDRRLGPEGTAPTLFNKVRSCLFNNNNTGVRIDGKTVAEEADLKSHVGGNFVEKSIFTGHKSQAIHIIRNGKTLPNIISHCVFNNIVGPNFRDVQDETKLFLPHGGGLTPSTQTLFYENAFYPSSARPEFQQDNNLDGVADAVDNPEFERPPLGINPLKLPWKPDPKPLMLSEVVSMPGASVPFDKDSWPPIL